jgi:hypothetical protein
MVTTTRGRKIATVGATLLVVLAGFLEVGEQGKAPAEPPADDPYHTEKFRGAGACMRCHTLKAGVDKEDFVLLTEYTTWRFHDKHSVAYAVLEGPRGQRILRTLHGKTEGMIDATKERSCLNCHALSFPNRLEDQLALKDGVSCESCHGPSTKWFTPHFNPSGEWRLLSGEEKYAKYGMYDVRDPARRAELCLSCHIGNAAQGKVVTHAMFAAGHPPLRSMEVSLFSDNMPRHWRLIKDVPFLRDAEARQKADLKPEERKKVDQILSAYHFATREYQQSQLTLATSAVGLRTEMQLVAERADVKAKLSAQEAEVRWPELALTNFDANTDPVQRWPELAMAHSDCYGCHHELQVPSWRQQRGYVGKPGRPQLRTWPLALAKFGVCAEDIPPSTGEPLSSRLQQLGLACSGRPFGDPARLVPAARTVFDWPQHLERLKTTKVNRLQLLKKLCALPADEYPDFESARQIVSAFQVLYTELEAKPPQDGKISKTLADLEERLNIQSLAWARKERIRLFVNLLGKVSKTEDLLKEPKSIDALNQITSQGFEEAKLDPDTRKALRSFLNTMRDQDPQKFTAALFENDQAFLKALQAINDREFEENTKKMSHYNPSAFRKTLKGLADSLPKE